jgi:hypothetical protein
VTHAALALKTVNSLAVASSLPHFVHRMRGPNDGTVRSSGQASTLTAVSRSQARRSRTARARRSGACCRASSGKSARRGGSWFAHPMPVRPTRHLSLAIGLRSRFPARPDLDRWSRRLLVRRAVGLLGHGRPTPATAALFLPRCPTTNRTVGSRRLDAFFTVPGE